MIIPPKLLIYDKARKLHILQAQVCDWIKVKNEIGSSCDAS